MGVEQLNEAGDQNFKGLGKESTGRGELGKKKGKDLKRVAMKTSRNLRDTVSPVGHCA